MKWIDLNCDLGESFGPYSLGEDTAIMPYITSANVACGYHAGDPVCMARTVAAAAEASVGIGAHPGVPDLLGFGRRELRCTPEEVTAYLQYQIGALWAFAAARHTRIQHVKPHGALYNMACKDRELAQAVVRGIVSVDRELILLCPAGSQLEQEGLRAGLPVAREVFADRAYRADGSLLPRSQPEAVIPDPEEVAARAVRMAVEGTVQAVTGETISLQADSICVHGDTPGAVRLVQKIRQALLDTGVAPAPLREVIQHAGGGVS